MLSILTITLRGFLRDRIVYALLGVAIFLLLLIPAMSSFSMRQVQELSITLSLSATSLLLLVLAILLGAASIWGDLEHRYTAGLLGLPLSRRAYLLGKFAGIAIFLLACCALLSCSGLAVIAFAKLQYPAAIQPPWGTILLASAMIGLQYVLLAAFALLFSTLSTSFFLPVFGTLSIYLAGSSSQEVYDYVNSDLGAGLGPLLRFAAEIFYYTIPNFAAFDLKVQAVYGLPLDGLNLLGVLVYALSYLAVVLTVAVWLFERRDLP